MATAPADPSGRPSGWELSIRGGWGRYGAVDWWHGEVEGRRALGPLLVLAGLDVVGLQRTLPPDQQQGTIERRWAAFFPVHAGLALRPWRGTVQPYLGGDVVAARYLANDPDWLLGWRGRGGVDVLLAAQGGVTVDIAFGRLEAERFTLLEPGAPASALVPRVALGVYFRL